MSKLFKWFKKDKTTQESEQDNNLPTSTSEAETNKPQQPVVVDEQLHIAKTEDTESVDSQVLPASIISTENLDVEVLDNDTSDASQAPISECKIDDAVALKAELVAEPANIEKPFNKVEATLEADPSEPSIEEQVTIEQKNAESIPEAGLLARLKASLSRTKANIGSGFTSLLMGKTIDEDLYEELETQLLLADVGMNTTNKIIDELTKSAKISQLKDGGALSGMLQSQMQIILDKVNVPIDFNIAIDEKGQKHPFVILMVGVNGVGKTTTIGKLAKQYQAQGKSVMLAAGDTFRAAAVEQLEVWGERNNIHVVAQHTGADSASVIFDAIESAKARNVDILIADTAGRLQNKAHLIEELKKVVRVMKKLNPQAPHEVMLTLDASTGQNAVSQTRIFNEAVGITGINLTKLDGSAKGGVIFALADEFAIPVRYIGIGEGIDDLRQFDSKAFVEALFS
jgi:fused signal recognition particle receptor